MSAAGLPPHSRRPRFENQIHFCAHHHGRRRHARPASTNPSRPSRLRFRICGYILSSGKLNAPGKTQLEQNSKNEIQKEIPPGKPATRTQIHRFLTYGGLANRGSYRKSSIANRSKVL